MIQQFKADVKTQIQDETEIQAISNVEVADKFVRLVDMTLAPTPANIPGAAYVLTIEEAGRVIRRLTSGTTTVPNNTDEEIPVGNYFSIRNCSTGSHTVNPGSGVTFLPSGSVTLAPYESASFHKVDVNTWDVYANTSEGTPVEGPLVTLTFTGSTTDTEADVTGVTGAASAVTSFSFHSISNPLGVPADMTLLLGGVAVFVATFPTDYIDTAWTYTHSTGEQYTGLFADGEIILT